MDRKAQYTQMNKTLQEFNLAQRASQSQKFRAGDVVKVFRKIIEGGKERTQLFEGMIIAIKGGQSSSQVITVRKVSNGYGVELILPILSPIIEKIELVKRAKVRSAKLYFVRDRSTKSLKMKYRGAADILAKEKVVEEKVVTEETSKEEEEK